ncbi:MAG: ParB/RepB/Spo0J family partition protein [Candidatus Nanopelagicales bacterium]|nr:ParB/RepB/Spo0J family partition protein [Candidatus Nanopelagicales bacterium]
MSAKRGLAALIPTAPGPDRRTMRDAGPPDQLSVETTVDVTDQSGPAVVHGLELVTVAVTDVAPNPRQPRTEFDPDALAELARSLLEVGFLQPIVVRRVAARSSRKPHYELVAGERRWRAATAAGLTEVPALVRSTEDDELLREALLENLQRVALNPLEEAAAYEQLLADFGGTHDELAVRLGRSRPQVSNTLRLLKLPPTVQRRVAAGVLSAGHARTLLSLADEAAMEQLAKRVVAEGISVRGLEEIVAVQANSPAKKTRRSTAKQVLPELAAVGQRLGDLLETRVHVSMGQTKGKIVIEFAGIEDLARIATALGDTPEL